MKNYIAARRAPYIIAICCSVCAVAGIIANIVLSSPALTAQGVLVYIFTASAAAVLIFAAPRDMRWFCLPALFAVILQIFALALTAESFAGETMDLPYILVYIIMPVTESVAWLMLVSNVITCRFYAACRAFFIAAIALRTAYCFMVSFIDWTVFADAAMLSLLFEKRICEL